MEDLFNMESESYNKIRYEIVPPVFLVVFTALAQILVGIGNPDLGFSLFSLFSIGSIFAWKIVILFYLWAFISLKIPSKPFRGPATPHGYVPVYAANGTQYYLASLAAFAVIVFINPQLCLDVYEDFRAIVAVLNITALVLCAWLVHKARTSPEDDEPQKDFPLAYQFYRGIELHPRLLGVDIKQWTNCRVGMMGWAILVIVFAVASNLKNGFAPGSIVNAFLINVYLLKFFYWETGYFNTLDITLDRAGYYLCWGCLCWVQTLYTFSAYFMVGNPSKAGLTESVAVLVFGLVVCLLNYAVDRQKETFRATNGKCHVWGRPAKFVEVTYTTHEAKKKKSRLMTSGFWGISRHLNYVFEILLALSWSLPALGHGVRPFFYVIFLTVLLVHRTFRDEEKCRAKYGQGWDEYCKQVPYRMIPFVF